ncbi:PD-(D/E)XK nuclease superfamily [Micromonospora echinospora]|uniref:PD-(D/E)XK nuclease superfamily n=2 Tax=Micromonospora echinospora TaxID=1877 RepID=A0A1C5ABA1_MICEC|nr:PD-(D/E)XK nuclease superfamily [Micromonospora echinospora]
MTTPKINTISRGGSRFYVNPETGEKAPGVTSILGMLPKPFLQHWAAKVVAEYATDNLGELVGLRLNGDRQGVIDFLKGAPRRDTARAAETGTAVHDAFEKIAKGQPVGRLHPDYRVYVDHFEEFLKEFAPEFVFLEETVWSETWDYAGSFDAYAVIDGERVFLDWKTTRSGVHPEVALQLAAYRHADYIIRPDGSRVPQPSSTAGGVLHVRPEGWGFYPVRTDEAVFDVFTTLRKVFDWDRAMKETVVGAPINKRPGSMPARRTAAPRRAAA